MGNREVIIQMVIYAGAVLFLDWFSKPRFALRIHESAYSNRLSLLLEAFEERPVFYFPGNNRTTCAEKRTLYPRGK